MKFMHYENLGEAIPRKSKIGLLVFNHAFFIGDSDGMGIQIVVCSMQHDPSAKTGWRRTWFKVVNETKKNLKLGKFLLYLGRRDHKGSLPASTGYLPRSDKHNHFVRKFWRIYFSDTPQEGGEK